MSFGSKGEPPRFHSTSSHTSIANLGSNSCPSTCFYPCRLHTMRVSPDDQIGNGAHRASAVPKVRVNGRSEDVIFFDGVFFESSLKSIFFAS